MHLPNKNGRKLKHAAVKTSPKYGGVTSKLPCTLSLCPLGIILIRTKITMGKKKRKLWRFLRLCEDSLKRTTILSWQKR